MEKNKFLLPPGFRDLLPDAAEQEYFCTKILIDNFYNHGYRLVAPPLLEFEDSLFVGAGENLEKRTLKLLDPLSQKMLGLRADITPQISRLVTSRLTQSKLPLKLCYAGDIVRSYALNTRGQRQLRQVGIEYINKKISTSADADVAIIALQSLSKLGVKNLSIDLNTPNLINNLGFDLNEEMKRSIEKRDFSKLPAEISALIKASGAADKAFDNTANLHLTHAAKMQIDSCREIYQKIAGKKLGANITIDFVENRGFEYHQTFSFSIFAKDIRDELGRGGRYIIGDMEGTGFTVYVNSFAEFIKAVMP